LRALKLSGGDDESSIKDSFGDKLKGFAQASSATIKKTLHKGRETLKGAAESMQNAAELRSSRGRKSMGDGDLEDGELTLLNDLDDDGTNRLDGDEEKPF